MRILVLFSACVLFSISARAETEILSQLPENLMPQLREVLDAAMVGSEDMQIRDLIERESKGKKITARGAMLPSFKANVSFRKEEDQGTNKELGFQDRAVYSVSISQPVYHWGAKQSEKRMGVLGLEAESVTSELVAERVGNRTRRDYMDLVILRQELAYAERALQIERDDYAFKEKQVEAGTLSPSVLDRDILDLEKREISFKRSQNSWESKLLEFGLAVGLKPEEVETLLVEEIPAFEPIEAEQLGALESYFTGAVSQDEAVQRMELDLGVEKERFKITDKLMRPKVDAVVGVSSNALDLDGTRREQEYTYFGLSVNWSIFDGFRTKGRRIEALSRMERGERSKAVLEASLLRNYDRLVKALELSGRSLKIEETLLAMAGGQLDRVRESVDEGRMSESDRKSYEQRLIAASLSAQRARVDYLDTLAQLAVALGLEDYSR